MGQAHDVKGATTCSGLIGSSRAPAARTCSVTLIRICLDEQPRGKVPRWSSSLRPSWAKHQKTTAFAWSFFVEAKPLSCILYTLLFAAVLMHRVHTSCRLPFRCFVCKLTCCLRLVAVLLLLRLFPTKPPRLHRSHAFPIEMIAFMSGRSVSVWPDNVKSDLFARNVFRYDAPCE